MKATTTGGIQTMIYVETGGQKMEKLILIGYSSL